MAAQGKETIRLSDLSIGYPGKDSPHIVARHIDASLLNGELTCLLGANGAGKSTMLRTISAFQPPLDGHIFLDGRNVTEYTRAELARQIAVVLTDRCDISGMTVFELVALGRTPYTDFWGKLSDDDKAVVDRALALVGITTLSHRPLQTLSDGERQKAMIAKALAQATPIILLDEPTAFLDFPSKVDVMQLLRRLSKETGKSILLSTHDLELALQIADKIWLLPSSKAMITGTPEDLSLNGELTHFFDRRGISFDEQTGLFCVNNDIRYHIRLRGSGERANMVRKALLRNGIGTDADDSKIVVDINDTTYRLSDNTAFISETSTIEELLQSVLKLILQN